MNRIKKIIAISLTFCVLAGIFMLIAGCSQQEKRFYTLQEAYDAGLLSKEDLLSIAYYYHSDRQPDNDGRAYNEEIMAADFEPYGRDGKTLSDSQKLAVTTSVAKELNAKYDTDKFNKDNLHVIAYYGTYDGGLAVRMAYYVNDYYAVNDAIRKITVKGVNVMYYYPCYACFESNNESAFTDEIMFWNGNVD